MSRRVYTIIGLIALFAVVAAVIYFVFVLNKDLFSNKSAGPRPEYSPPPTPVEPVPAPEITIYKSGTAQKPTLVVVWKNLAEDTIRINIYRSGACNITEDQLWKIIKVGGATQSGAVEIQLKLKEAQCNFSYTTETISEGGQSSWYSSSSPPNPNLPPNFVPPFNGSSTVSDPPPLPPAPPPAPPSPVPPGTPPAPPQSSSTPPAPPPATPPPPPPSGGSPPPPPGPDQHIYYSPQSQPSGYDNPPVGSFWLQHIDQAIQIGWQNLPSSTDRIIVSRSSAENGPWTVILNQFHPDIIGPYTIRLADNSVNQPYYYELKAEEGTTILVTHGPVFLPPQ